MGSIVKKAKLPLILGTVALLAGSMITQASHAAEVEPPSNKATSSLVSELGDKLTPEPTPELDSAEPPSPAPTPTPEEDSKEPIAKRVQKAYEEWRTVANEVDQEEGVNTARDEFIKVDHEFDQDEGVKTARDAWLALYTEPNKTPDQEIKTKEAFKIYQEKLGKLKTPEWKAKYQKSYKKYKDAENKLQTPEWTHKHNRSFQKYLDLKEEEKTGIKPDREVPKTPAPMNFIDYGGFSDTPEIEDAKSAIENTEKDLEKGYQDKRDRSGVSAINKKIEAKEQTYLNTPEAKAFEEIKSKFLNNYYKAHPEKVLFQDEDVADTKEGQDYIANKAAGRAHWMSYHDANIKPLEDK